MTRSITTTSSERRPSSRPRGEDRAGRSQNDKFVRRSAVQEVSEPSQVIPEPVDGKVKVEDEDNTPPVVADQSDSKPKPSGTEENKEDKSMKSVTIYLILNNGCRGHGDLIASGQARSD